MNFDVKYNNNITTQIFKLYLRESNQNHSKKKPKRAWGELLAVFYNDSTNAGASCPWSLRFGS